MEFPPAAGGSRLAPRRSAFGELMQWIPGARWLEGRVPVRYLVRVIDDVKAGLNQYLVLK